jgi:hypothetical protein
LPTMAKLTDSSLVLLNQNSAIASCYCSKIAPSLHSPRVVESNWRNYLIPRVVVPKWHLHYPHPIPRVVEPKYRTCLIPRVAVPIWRLHSPYLIPCVVGPKWSLHLLVDRAGISKKNAENRNINF